MKKENYSYKDFKKVEIGSTFDFDIVQSASFGVTVEADEGLFKNLHIESEKGTLKAYHSRHIGWVFRLNRPRIKISMPVINELKLSGAVVGDVNGFKSKEDFKLNMDGACKVNVDMAVNNCEVRLRGACSIDARGKAESLIVDVNGACHLEMDEFAVENAAIRLNGASNCKARVSGRLDARLAGVSNLDIIGEPTIGDIRTTGLAKINKIS